MALAVAPSVEIVVQGAASTTRCPGSATAPSFLCVYETDTDNPGNLQVFNPVTNVLNQASRFGAGLQLSGAATLHRSIGTWAVKAP